MSEWKTYKLGDLIEINKNSINKNYSFEEIEYLDTSSVTENRFSELQKLKLSEAPSRAKRVVNENDIVYSTVRPILRHYGIAKNIKPNTVASTGFAVLTSKEIDPNFLFYYLTTDEIVYFLNGVAEANTTTFPAFNASLFEQIEVTIPESIETQTAIVQILSSLDDKIELNLQMNQTLEAMAQAIFKEWFVDFNFPGSEKPKVKNEKSSQSKNPENQGADNLPKGWRVIELSKLISVKDGTHDSPKPTENGKFLITSKHLKNHFIDFESAYRISEDDFEKINKRSKVDKLDVLITMIGTVGNLYFVHDEIIDFAIKNIGLFKISENPDLAYFLYFTISSKRISDYFTKRLAGSTQQYLTLETLRLTPILLPDDKTLKLFNDFAKSIYQKIETNRRNIQTLTQTRDTLLPKLMSGKIELV
ncbi:MAG: restriction endonuclease subunit S [Bacteroidetes bacterium]|nr:restriction endonuclease subunit S [Bacteroidota bacterium]